MRSLAAFRASLASAAFLACAALLPACSVVGRSPPRQGTSPVWPHAVSYEIFVHAFADSDGDGIGDLPGLTARLDYLRDLGVRALWLMPIHPSPSYHKYDVIDYRAVHPDYGTMEDFEAFLREARARDIRVVIDLVINHTSSDHPWFRAAVADTAGPLHEFYVWVPSSQVERMRLAPTGLDSDNLHQWHPVEALNRHFYGFFWHGMPDLNFDSPAVRDSVYAIGRFWLEKGVDGFRLDAARHIFADDRESDNHAWWEAFRAEMEKVRPDVLLVGEVWAPAEVAAHYLRGLHSVFNFDLARELLEAVRTGRGAGVAGRHAAIREAYAAVSADFVDATFLANHDQDRVMSALEDPRKARVAAGLLLTLPGAPYLYYGEEIGMRGMKPDPHIREPFLWSAPPDRERTTWIEPIHSTDRTVVPMQSQTQTDTSLLAHYRTLIALRNSQPALATGGMEPREADERLVAFLRSHPAGDLLVVHNVSGDTVEAALPEAGAFRSAVYSQAGARRTGGGVLLPPFASLVLRR